MVEEKSLLQKRNSSITKRNPEELDELLCPTERQAKFQLFPTECKINNDCKSMGSQFRCCKLFGSNRCIEGIPKPIEDVEHERKPTVNFFNQTFSIKLIFFQLCLEFLENVQKNP